MRKTSNSKGKNFERAVGKKLWSIASRFPDLVEVTYQQEIKLNDGRSKFLDYALDYTLFSSSHRIAIECQDRKSWSTQIVDKILTIRNHSYRNRFWFVYNEEDFLTEEAKNLLDIAVASDLD